MLSLDRFPKNVVVGFFGMKRTELILSAFSVTG